MNEVEEINFVAEHVHAFLVKFLERFNTTLRGGIHDQIEVILFTQLRAVIKSMAEKIEDRPSPDEAFSLILNSMRVTLETIDRDFQEAKK